MKKKIIVALLLLPAAAYAEFFSGNELFRRMNSQEANERIVALGYVMGASDAYQNNFHCSPQSVTSGQTRDVVKLFMEKNPSIRDLAADIIVAQALKEAWPCPEKKKQGKGSGV